MACGIRSNMGDVLWSPRRATALRAILTALMLSLADNTDARNHGVTHADGGANHEAQVRFFRSFLE